MVILYFYVVCFTFSISYSVLSFHLVYVFQFLSLSLFFLLMFFLMLFPSVVEKLSLSFMEQVFLSFSCFQTNPFESKLCIFPIFSVYFLLAPHCLHSSAPNMLLPPTPLLSFIF